MACLLWFGHKLMFQPEAQTHGISIAVDYEGIKWKIESTPSELIMDSERLFLACMPLRYKVVSGSRIMLRSNECELCLNVERSTWPESPCLLGIALQYHFRMPRWMRIAVRVMRTFIPNEAVEQFGMSSPQLKKGWGRVDFLGKENLPVGFGPGTAECGDRLFDKTWGEWSSEHEQVSSAFAQMSS